MKTIILDYAHGEDVAGKRSPDGRHRECRWSRKILNRIKDNLISKNIKVELSNIGDNEIGLNQRVHKMNQINSPAFVFSLHNNAAGMGDKWMSARGASIWTTRGITKSDAFAEFIVNELESKISEMKWRKDQYSDGDSDYESNFTVLMSMHPSVLLEWGFQDNQEDLSIIENPSVEDKLVEVLTSCLETIANEK
jgi:N-acetylmuramoyl-L-alanine amidase